MWRERAAPIVAKILEKSKHRTPKEINAALRDAYPFGERKYQPYKIWLDEIQRQRGFKTAKRPLTTVKAPDPNQGDFFE